ncbi:hypothetical protein PanWU01x14_069730 [Parasponia andersonii]|uniref:Uncharacterized protein n=1 Tax=Parasponia andersonii TaxID=3476 RepID=A0A2P5DEN7_PARAD|nr:hypothetical protein PanWU01x14_069730 [Parasponia andersonii]
MFVLYGTAAPNFAPRYQDAQDSGVAVPQNTNPVLCEWHGSITGLIPWRHVAMHLASWCHSLALRLQVFGILGTTTPLPSTTTPCL